MVDLGRVLDVAISDEAPLSIIRAIVEADPEAPFSHRFSSDGFPLHRAADDAPLEIVRMLVDRVPQELMEKNFKSKLPIHIAVGAGTWHFPKLRSAMGSRAVFRKSRALMTSFRSAGVIKCLIDACPESLLEKDKYGNTPLHIAVKFASAEVVEMLVNACPKALLEKDADGQLPLHVALNDAATPLAILRCLVMGCPQQALLEKDADGQPPLHVVVADTDTPLEIVRCLVDACPMALQAKDDDEDLPLHVAAVHASLETIQLLVERRPDSVQAKNKDGECPVDRARHRFRHEDGLEQLFAQLDEAATAAAAAGTTTSPLGHTAVEEDSSSGQDSSEAGSASSQVLSSVALGEAAVAATRRRRRSHDEGAVPDAALSGGVEVLAPPGHEGLSPHTSGAASTAATKEDSNKKPRANRDCYAGCGGGFSARGLVGTAKRR
jgi:ankyrin repeat protein